jgi:hypothetical protein
MDNFLFFGGISAFLFGPWFFAEKHPWLYWVIIATWVTIGIAILVGVILAGQPSDGSDLQYWGVD